MEWSIVRFLCDEKISHVPTKWLCGVNNENIPLCFWPKKNAGKFIMDRADPDPEDWYKLDVVVLKQTASYTEAREQTKLMSEGESQPEVDKPLGKGRRKHKKTIFLVDDESDMEDLEGQITPPPNMETFKKSQKNKQTKKPHFLVDDESDMEDLGGQITPLPNMETFKKSQKNKQTFIRTVSTETIAFQKEFDSVADNDNHGLGASTAESNNCGGNVEESAILKSILCNVIACRKMLEQTTAAERAKTYDNTITTDFTFVPTKPFKKLKKLKQFDETLADEKVYLQNETALFLVGGANPKELIRRGLKKIFSDKLSMRCSWTGRKDNFPLKNLKIMEVLKIAARKKFGSVTDSEFQAEVGLWFRQGKPRFDRSQAALNKHIQDETNENG